jgi:hypothetical protein
MSVMHLVENFFYCSLLCVTQILQYTKNINLPVGLYGCVSLSLAVKEEQSLTVPQKRMLNRIHVRKKQVEVNEDTENDVTKSQFEHFSNIMRVIRSELKRGKRAGG